MAQALYTKHVAIRASQAESGIEYENKWNERNQLISVPSITREIFNLQPIFGVPLGSIYSAFSNKFLHFSPNVFPIASESFEA